MTHQRTYTSRANYKNSAAGGTTPLRPALCTLRPAPMKHRTHTAPCTAHNQNGSPYELPYSCLLKYGVRPPHHGNTCFPEDFRDGFHFRADRAVPSVVAAADAEMHCVRLHGKDPLYFFVQSLILPREMAAAAAFHEGPHTEGLITIGGKALGPSVEGGETSRAGADIFRPGTGQKYDGFHKPAFLAMASASFQCFGI